ncbi:MAG: NAD(P)/FAD-dependent oxidoreductase [Parvibaculaceae bacterium]
MTERIVIVGGGQAAVSLGAALRELHHDCQVTIIGDEPYPPYQRPPLSKKYLLGETARENLQIRPPDWYRNNAIELRLGARARALDRRARTVALVDGTVLLYDRLVLATGASPRQLPAAIGGRLGGVWTIRGLADIDRLSSSFHQSRSVLLVGGGYVGLEIAAVAARKGLNVTLVEAAGRILQRVAAQDTSDFFRKLHAQNGVRIIEGVGIGHFHERNGRVSGASLTNGEEIAAELVIVGIGAIPNDQLAVAAGLDVSDGIRVDAACRTSDPRVLAIGDCATFEHEGRPLRLESVPNAIDMARTAALAIVTGEACYRPMPWFWSDQYDIKLQIAGLSHGYDRTVARPGKREGSSSVWYFKGDRLIAVDAMNDAASYMMSKKIIEQGNTLPISLVQDLSSDLRRAPPGVH